jgi:hypothetical protein
VWRQGLQLRTQCAGCFASLSYSELVGPANRKIVSLAQVRRRNGAAIYAGLLLDRIGAIVAYLLGRRDEAVAQSL